MFHVKYVVLENNVKDFSECNLPYGITNDFLLVSKTSICVKTDDMPLRKYPPDTAFFFPKGTPYYYSPYRGEPYNDNFIHFTCDESFYTEYMLPVAQPIYLCDPDGICKLFEMIAYENILTGPNKNEILNNLMKILFMKIRESAEISDTIPYYKELLNIRYNIFNHPEQPWTLEMISKSLHISPAYTYSLYKEAFHTTCMQDLIESRIRYAKHALAYSKQSINEIAFHSGYNSAEHFCRQFKKYTGMRPSQYRESKNPVIPPP
ncbi:MAG: helix-turn-helix transcriptional regulator [Lachnospiraceae bacterium]|nr:helix-turn-helix transcriptional regulator [Lachnospiraceae bacterium]